MKFKIAIRLYSSFTRWSTLSQILSPRHLAESLVFAESLRFQLFVLLVLIQYLPGGPAFCSA
jgi:hypothetical protein